MKIEKVFYSKKFPYAPFLNEDIGFEISLSEGENPIEALNTLKKMAEKYHRDTNPQLFINEVPDKPVIAENKTNGKPLTRTGAIIHDIGTCKELKVLESYKLIAKNNPEIQQAYDSQFKKLANE